ncbi:rhamnogalacturonan acetylesterase [Segetibacter sp. 3557_3]|uniref:rhamnogalacturonan acetylesterase n=1 Tax=Segetibacter sp. 3557_3 TaxID=2547429 RepID=UPI001058B425|nr:rhamnogalacturonan acetylesterase [Segetibacter sp. 3557_3]TDH26463.1 rhamnogalacturonan acetylesterase [Segetibacter sp. 3557_3]
MKAKHIILVFCIFCCSASFVILRQEKRPTFYTIGDSTVKNGRGNGAGGLWGWGDFIAAYFDTNRIAVQNHALGGTSSRTFQTQGLWNKVLEKLQPGDYVIMQFGHNDGSPLDDTARARGTIQGVGDESKEIYNPITKKQEVVYTYGWYLRKFVSDTKAKGAIPIICSPIPRNNFKEGKVSRAADSYGGWAAQVAQQTGSYFVDLNQIIADKYDELGSDKAKAFFTEKDHTHTNKAGAKLNAAGVVEGIRKLPALPLNKFLVQ